MLLFAIALTLGEFHFTPPPGWTAKQVANGYEATGPAGAGMRISVYTIKDGTTDAEGAAAAKKVRDAAIKAVDQLGLVAQMQPRVRQLNNGNLEEALYTSQDALTYLALYVLTGKHGVVVATVEGNATHVKDIVPVRAAFVDALGGQ